MRLRIAFRSRLANARNTTTPIARNSAARVRLSSSGASGLYEFSTIMSMTRNAEMHQAMACVWLTAYIR